MGPDAALHKLNRLRRLTRVGVRELRCTGNAIERTAILAGGSPTHLQSVRSFPPRVESFTSRLAAFLSLPQNRLYWNWAREHHAKFFRAHSRHYAWRSPSSRATRRRSAVVHQGHLQDVQGNLRRVAANVQPASRLWWTRTPRKRGTAMSAGSTGRSSSTPRTHSSSSRSCLSPSRPWPRKCGQ
jgi:hypothetical protein